MGLRQIACLGLVALVGWLVPAAARPASAAALDSDLKHSAAFKLRGSNGYSIVVVAASERADGRGDVFLIVYRKDAVATYAAPATLTATTVEADLGRLGSISLEVGRSDGERTLHRRCGDEAEKFTFEPQSYRGIFEFHGEEGFTEATSTSPREYTRFFLDLFCGGASGGETFGATLPGARLRARTGSGHHRWSVQFNKNRPGAPSTFEVAVSERRSGIAITRTVSGRVGSDAFDYDPLLRTATIAPPVPFSGRATFRRDAVPANRWRGSLTVDLPGRSDVPLTGPGSRATLARACLHEGNSASRC